MFRAFPLPNIRSFLLYIRHWYISCSFYDSFQAGSILTLLGNSHQTCMKYTSAERTIENSWWWAEKMPETCRNFFDKINLGNYCVWLVLLKKKFVTMHGHVNLKCCRPIRYFADYAIICPSDVSVAVVLTSN